MNFKHQFFNDYAETAHPACIQKLSEHPLQQEAGYGMDSISAQARGLIRAKIAQPAAEVHFISGGTQANLTLIGSVLRPHEAVIAMATGHIAANETGAIEATGHKVIHVAHNHVPMPIDGKLTPLAIEQTMRAHPNEHTVKPRMAFVSQSTELGTVYRLDELRALRASCDAHDLYLFIDGARIGSALASAHADFSLADIAQLADAFYIGGTKNGALLGEAMVIVNPALQSDFRYAMKQRGALLAKGRVMASQFVALFADGLFEQLAHQANATAQALRAGLSEMGIAFYTDSPSNQIFPILPDSMIDALQKDYGFYKWAAYDAYSSVTRFVTSWATPMDAVEQLLADVRVLMAQ